MPTTIIRTIQWISIPILLLASVFFHSTPRYEASVSLVVCLAAVAFVRRFEEGRRMEDTDHHAGAQSNFGGSRRATHNELRSAES